MEGLKFIGPLLVLALLVLAVAMSPARFAGDSADSESDVSDGLTSTLGDVLGESESLEAMANGETTEGTEDEEGFSASADANSSTRIDFDFSSDIDIDVEGEGSASVDQNEKNPTFKIGNQEFTCLDGEEIEWEDENSEAECDNDDGDIDFDFKGQGPSSVRFHVDIN